MGKLIRRNGRVQGWEYKEIMTAGVNSDTIRIPPLNEGAMVSVSLVIATGEGKIQFTTSPDADVIADSAEWQDWPLGLCTDTCSDALIGPATGLRLVRVSGTVGIEIII